jgi:exopolysaccharide biosynthesis polyprenyl glycosylphosphotransferase
VRLFDPETGKLEEAEDQAASPSALSAATAAPTADRALHQIGSEVPQGSITDRELAFVQVSTDFLCSYIALPLSLLLLSVLSSVPINSVHQLGTNFAVDSLFPVAVILTMALGGMYRTTHRRLQPSAFLEIRELSFGVGSGCVLTIGVGALLHVTFSTTEPNATQLVFAVIVTVAVISLGRIVMRFFLHALTVTRVLVVGSGNLAERIMTNVRQDPGMVLVGRVVDEDIVPDGVDGRVSDLPMLCPRLNVHRILISFPGEVSEESLNIYRQLQDTVHLAMVPRFFELVSWRSQMSDLSGTPFLELARPHLSLWDKFMKRAFDIGISSIVLLVTSPLLLLVAIGVKLSSPGPVFFHQTRLGRHQHPFTITKFRSMRTLSEDDRRGEEAPNEPEDSNRPLHELRGKLSEQDRITRFGEFLRKTSIDEIPQFINVFRGDMSVVGPRPFIPSESGVVGWGSRRFDVRPGITGLWQVSGRNDLTRNDLVQLDYLYVASWSMWWDLKIMWETPKTMARGTGAY